MAVIFWVKSYNVKGKPPVFSVAAINIIPLGVSVRHLQRVDDALNTHVDQYPHDNLRPYFFMGIRQSAKIFAVPIDDFCWRVWNYHIYRFGSY